MGIPRGTARLLLDEARRRPFAGSVIELGKMMVFFSRRELEKWAALHGVPLAAVEHTGLSHDPVLAAQGCLDDRSFFSLLGFDEVVSCDISRWEGADVLWDLNRPVPEELHQRFDVVFEAGTIQHVFNLPQVFANVYRLLKPGGRVIHGMSPSNNHVDHGFYMFSPTLFYDFYTANGFDLEALYFFDFMSYWVRGRYDTTRWRIRRYQPGCLDHLNYGRFGNRQAGIFTVATKREGSTMDVNPQERYYRELWEQRGELEVPPAGDPAPAPDEAPGRRVYDPLLALWKRLREITRRWGPKRLPPVVARY